ncbi:MAG TPA: hypothetical protein VM286_02295 [Candidatus Thermoplasmatota archaeon]|nr:hypothetical protein [Candidatus Thermoplasmatota archaeon]
MTPRTVPVLLLASLLAVSAFAAAEGGPGPESRPCSDRPKERCPSPTPHRDEKGDEREFIQFTVESPTRLAAYMVDGRPVLDSLELDPGSGASHAPDRKGDAIVLGDADTQLRLHDNPVGQIEFKGKDGAVTLAFPAGTLVQAGPHGARIAYGDGRSALLVSDNATWDGLTVTLTSFFGFHVNKASGPFADGPAPGELRGRLQQAMEDRHLGAEVELRHHPANASRAIQVVAYDDMSVQVHLPGDGAPIAVTLSSNLTEGRTVVLHVDPVLVRNSTADRLELRYFDDNADGTRTEVVFVRAASLADVLDPTDDAGTPEYWVVADANGLEVLVSVPHWSVHTISIAGLGAVLQPSVLAGLLAGVAGTLVAATGMFWPRRPR